LFFLTIRPGDQQIVVLDMRALRRQSERAATRGRGLGATPHQTRSQRSGGSGGCGPGRQRGP
jgi:hypothetical protein